MVSISEIKTNNPDLFNKIIEKASMDKDSLISDKEIERVISRKMIRDPSLMELLVNYFK